GSLWTFTATATDPDLPHDALAFSLGNAPSGASIDASTGICTWTPTEAQGPGDYTFQVRVTDAIGFYDEKSVSVHVNEVNEAPTLSLPSLPPPTDEGGLLTFTATATDPDLPANTLTFSLTGTVPDGASIDAASGVFTWTPTEAQGPGDYTFQVRGKDDGEVYDEELVSIHVHECTSA